MSRPSILIKVSLSLFVLASLLFIYGVLQPNPYCDVLAPECSGHYSHWQSIYASYLLPFSLSVDFGLGAIALAGVWFFAVRLRGSLSVRNAVLWGVLGLGLLGFGYEAFIYNDVMLSLVFPFNYAPFSPIMWVLRLWASAYEGVFWWIPEGVWGLGDPGLVAGGFFLLSVGAAFLLTRAERRTIWRRLAMTLLFGSLMVAAFEACLLATGPSYYWRIQVINAQLGTPLKWFSNADFLWTSLCGTIFSLAGLLGTSSWWSDSLLTRRTKADGPR